ncbi:MAG: glycosyltransferase [Synechococcus sp.]
MKHESPDSCLISVVMPVLNAAGHLSTALSSLALQRFRDFEIVIVDGGSSDQTIAMAQSMLSADGIRHRIEPLPGSGIYEAMNHGIGLAQGEWLYVLGSDDHLVDADVFRRIAVALSEASADVLLVHGDVWIEQPGYRYGQAWSLPRLLDRNLSHQSAFYRCSAIQSLGLSYNPRYTLYADWDYNLKLLSCGRFQYVPIMIASYACTGASSQWVDALFLAEKEANALAYFGLRSLWRLPPDRYALAINSESSLLKQLGLACNRMLWVFRRLLQRHRS